MGRCMGRGSPEEGLWALLEARPIGGPTRSSQPLLITEKHDNHPIGASQGLHTRRMSHRCAPNGSMASLAILTASLGGRITAGRMFMHRNLKSCSALLLATAGVAALALPAPEGLKRTDLQ